ncbi:hypothetical protein [Pseudomonas sp. FME51]|uniref:hypothetical protein n=1 Tax=Pseudomonas sp. FME51 TaxID=2742609 RepID=UPI0018672238|nr:hypothetical protein [Pseudomonas sp. FME51]
MKIKILNILIIFLIISGCGYQSFDECVLSEMKGQQVSMKSTAEKVCERKFPYEKEIYSFRDGGFNLVWSKTLFNSIVIEAKENETDYRITKAKMRFSEKSCDESRVQDYNNILVFEFGSNGRSEAYTAKARQFKCMRTDSVYGVID